MDIVFNNLLKHSKEDLVFLHSELEIDYPDGYSNEWRKQQRDPRHNQSAFKGGR